VRVHLKELVVFVLFFVFSVSLIAQSAEETKQTPTPMPEMGAPKQIKEMAWMVGNWKTHTKAKMDPAQPNWTESDGEATFEMALDSCALVGHYKGVAGGMTFEGMNIITFHRELGKYQSYWLDNMGGFASFYYGDRDKTTGNIIYTGEDVYMGRKTYAKVTFRKSNEKTFVLEFDESTDGKNYRRTMETVHTRE
jgi:hypothetical protein